MLLLLLLLLLLLRCASSVSRRLRVSRPSLLLAKLQQLFTMLQTEIVKNEAAHDRTWRLQERERLLTESVKKNRSRLKHSKELLVKIKKKVQ